MTRNLPLGSLSITSGILESSVTVLSYVILALEDGNDDMSGRQERLRRKLLSGQPPKKRVCVVCEWWGLSHLPIRCPDCGGPTKEIKENE